LPIGKRLAGVTGGAFTGKRRSTTSSQTLGKKRAVPRAVRQGRIRRRKVYEKLGKCARERGKRSRKNQYLGVRFRKSGEKKKRN